MKKIGIFDSGVGGLTVLREILVRMPATEAIYLGDTARVPYGIRSAATVTRYALQNTDFLVEQGIEALVVACNTATATSLDELVKRFAPLPVVGVVEPGAARAVEATQKGKIAVLATEATIASGAYERAIQSKREDTEVVARACPLFVPLAEEGWTDNDVAERAAERYLADLPGVGVDTAVLGCTHYPLLTETIQRVLGDAITLVDSASSTAEALQERLRVEGTGEPVIRFYVTDAPDRFARVGERFLGRAITNVEHVDLV